MRIVLDTNVLIDALGDDFSAQAKLIDAVIDGEITALITPAIQREYSKILSKLINNPDYRDRINGFQAAGEQVTPQRVDMTLDDEDDYKFLQAAVGGSADLIVTSDRHLLDAGEVGAIDIVTPPEAWARFEDSDSGDSEWQNLVQGWGLGG